MFFKRKIKKTAPKRVVSVFQAFSMKEGTQRTSKVFATLQTSVIDEAVYEQNCARLRNMERKIERLNHFIFLLHLSKIPGCESTIYSFKYLCYYFEFMIFPTIPRDRVSVYDIY